MIGCAVFLLAILLLVFCFWQRIRRLPLPYYEGRHVVITGCDTGFGNMLAKELDSKGFSVFAGCLTNNGEENLKKSCSKKLKTFPLDVSDIKSIEKMLKFVTSHLPDDVGIWCLVNNAGIAGSVGPIDWLTRSDYEKVMAINLYGMVDMTNAFLPLIRREKGRIVNMTSICGRITLAPSPYCASKYAAEAYSDCLRRDLYKEGVTVHIIEPGFFATNITDPNKGKSALRTAYEKCDPDVRHYYGEPYLAESLEKAQKFLSLVTNNNSGLVVDAYLNAVCSRYPAPRYVVGFSAQVVFRILLSLPESISDFILCSARPVPVNMGKL
ncbi:dehydrogenase/reductase SDR family member 9-like [Saccostrea echinata]|uniref:dehydrogenase/reductase SDR family member 9-like n=1 Tax=Saccostrea echinata TaxID=191078 RepID=UPI002A81F663|nr:dehydrogenase/reductase SDR family member 9-like [Saccostrea echinata]